MEEDSEIVNLYWLKFRHIQHATLRRLESYGEKLFELGQVAYDKFNEVNPLNSYFASMPAHFQIENATLWSRTTSEDVTEILKNIWSRSGFTKIVDQPFDLILSKLPPHRESRFREDSILEVVYKYQDHVLSWTVLFVDTFTLPVFNKNDKRIPEYRFSDRDIMKATFKTSVECHDVSDKIASLSGPTNFPFYTDCSEVKQMFPKLIMDYFKMKYCKGKEGGYLEVQYDDDSTSTIASYV